MLMACPDTPVTSPRLIPHYPCPCAGSVHPDRRGRRHHGNARHDGQSVSAHQAHHPAPEGVHQEQPQQPAEPINGGSARRHVPDARAARHERDQREPVGAVSNGGHPNVRVAQMCPRRPKGPPSPAALHCAGAVGRPAGKRPSQDDPVARQFREQAAPSH